MVVSAYFACATVGRHSSARYWWGRMARLVPAFLATVVLTWVAVRYLAPADWYIPDKRDLVGNLLLLGNWRPQEFPFLDGSYWTLPLQLLAFHVPAPMWRARCGHRWGWAETMCSAMMACHSCVEGNDGVIRRYEDLSVPQAVMAIGISAA